MDAAGKDTTIKHVMSGVNPQGCQVYSFKAPSAEELDHDFMLRTTRCLPERGHRHLQPLVLRRNAHRPRPAPHPAEPESAPRARHTPIWRDRFEDLNAFERYATRKGIVTRKFDALEEMISRLRQSTGRSENSWRRCEPR